jgi:hydrogenase maturation protease
MRPAVVGVGNVLRGDDGLGVRLVTDLGPEIEALGADAIDGGTGGYGLVGLVEGRPVVVFVDACEMGLPPGEVRRFGAEEAGEAPLGALSGHEVGLAATIALVDRLDPSVRVRVVGVQPGAIPPDPFLELSDRARASYDAIKAEVLAAIRSELEVISYVR